MWRRLGLRSPKYRRICFEIAPGGAPAGGGGANPPPTTTPNPTEQFNNMLANQYRGDAVALASRLFDENYRLRNERRNGELPPGSAIISADEVKLLNAAKATNLKPEELTERVTNYNKVVDERDGLKKGQELFTVADAAGYKYSVMLDLDKLYGGLQYKVEHEKGEDDEQVAVVYVKIKDEWKKYEEHVQATKPDFLNSLIQSEAGSEESEASTKGASSERKSAPEKRERPRMSGQQSRGKTPQGEDVYARIRKEEEERQKAKKASSSGLHERFPTERR